MEATTEQQTVTVHLPVGACREWLSAIGWSIEDDGSYTRPYCQPRLKGGEFGSDYLWEFDEAVTQAFLGT
jgi:hypothetical protein